MKVQGGAREVSEGGETGLCRLNGEKKLSSSSDGDRERRPVGETGVMVALVLARLTVGETRSRGDIVPWTNLLGPACLKRTLAVILRAFGIWGVGRCGGVA